MEVGLPLVTSAAIRISKNQFLSCADGRCAYSCVFVQVGSFNPIRLLISKIILLVLLFD